MNHPNSGYPPAPQPAPRDTATPPAATTQVAREEAADLGRTAAQAGQDVAATAQEQAGQVAHEAQRQAKDLLSEARRQAQEQARLGQERASEGCRSLSDELRQMAHGAHDRGPASDLAEQAAAKVDDLAAWLQRHEPGDLLEEVRGLARRRPGAFLLGAVAAGVLTGRLTRGVVDAHRDTDGGGAPDAGSATTAPAHHHTSPATPAAAPRPTPMPGPVGPPPSSTPTHTERSDATTVGEYVEEVERRGDSPIGHPTPGGRP